MWSSEIISQNVAKGEKEIGNVQIIERLADRMRWPKMSNKSLED